VAIRQARLAMAEKKPTLYHISYGQDGTIILARKEKISGAPEGGPTVS